ncbi:MAG TPA: dioxygenase, partial [Agrobacterium sp.]|nr:dioxygenase [Agrobacterium sp.]
YFRTPGGILFEIATNEPGFDRDEDTAHLGEALKLPSRYEPFRNQIEANLAPLAA